MSHRNVQRFRIDLCIGTIFFIALAWLIFWTPAGRMAVIVLILAIAISGGALAVRTDWPPAVKTGAVVGGAILGLLLAFLAIPQAASISSDRRATPEAPREGESKPTSDGEPTPALSPSATASQEIPTSSNPLTITIGVPGDDPDCEPLAVPNLNPAFLPKRDEFTAEWVFDHGGSATSKLGTVVVIEGRIERTVILTGIDVVDVKRQAVPNGAATITKCGPSGGSLGIADFKIDFNLRKPMAVPVKNENDEIYRFPLTVNPNDPVWLHMHEVSKEACICSYRLRLKWLSDGQTGTSMIDRSFGPIKVVTKELPEYEWTEKGLVPL